MRTLVVGWGVMARVELMPVSAYLFLVDAAAVVGAQGCGWCSLAATACEQSTQLLVSVAFGARILTAAELRLAPEESRTEASRSRLWSNSILVVPGKTGLDESRPSEKVVRAVLLRDDAQTIAVPLVRGCIEFDIAVLPTSCGARKAESKNRVGNGARSR